MFFFSAAAEYLRKVLIRQVSFTGQLKNPSRKVCPPPSPHHFRERRGVVSLPQKPSVLRITKDETTLPLWPCSCWHCHCAALLLSWLLSPGAKSSSLRWQRDRDTFQREKSSKDLVAALQNTGMRRKKWFNTWEVMGPSVCLPTQALALSIT